MLSKKYYALRLKVDTATYPSVGRLCTRPRPRRVLAHIALIGGLFEYNYVLPLPLPGRMYTTVSAMLPMRFSVSKRMAPSAFLSFVSSLDG